LKSSMWYKIKLISAIKYHFCADLPAAPKFFEPGSGLIYSDDMIGHFDVFSILRRNGMEKVI
jgi:hypothetical protein